MPAQAYTGQPNMEAYKLLMDIYRSKYYDSDLLRPYVKPNNFTMLMDYFVQLVRCAMPRCASPA